jgi:ankyrin repeat protein
MTGIQKDEMVFRVSLNASIKSLFGVRLNRVPNQIGTYEKASMNEKYTSCLPVSVRREITNQLKNVADSVQESETRRVLASFEYSVMILCYPDTWKTSSSLISTALHYLHLAAASGYHHAQSVAGRLHYAFGSAMPESFETEVKWLSQASLKGSLTAMQRLRLLDPSHHLKVSRLIRFEYNGSFVRGALWSDTELLLRVIPFGYDVPPYFIHNLAAHGQLESLNCLSKLPPSHFNMTDNLGETPLVTACRCGHADVVALLLELGADPTIATYRGIHPLHFLSAFEDKYIPRVTNLLLTNGAILEAHCSQGDTYRQGIDGRFDVEAGTPLLWAVIAGNIEAINSLLHWGANIFAYQRLVPRDFTNDVFIHSSPLESAITRYRFDIVEILLASCKDIQWMRGKLNELRLVGPNTRASPLLLALNRPTEALMRIALTHGRRLQDAQLMTVGTLIRYGASLLEISREPSGQSISPIVLICEVNNLPLLRFLWNRDGGVHRPSNTRLFIDCIETAIQYSNKDVFDFLVAHKDDVHLDDDEPILYALAKVCNMSNNEHYVSSLVKLACHTSSSSTSTRNIVTNTGRPNFSIPLMVNLLAGNLKTAVLLCLHGDCDFMLEGQSLLAEVISLDAISPIATDRVDTLLSLATLVLSPSSRDDLFWRCGVHESKGRQTFFTAFHFAVSPQANGARIASELFIPAESNRKVLDHVLHNFHRPQFLNAQVDRLSARFPGDTALHIAAREGSLKSIEMILHGTYGRHIDRSLLNVYNQTFLDLSIMYYENAINESEDLLMCLGNLFTATAAASKIADLASTIESFFVEYECNISVFCLVVVRRSDNSFLFTCRPRVQFLVTFPNGKHPSLHPFFQICNSVYLIYNADYIPECHTLFSGDDSDGADLLQLGIGSLISFVDSPSDFGKVLSAKTREFIEGFS